MTDNRVPGVVKVSRADAIKIAVAVEADERMGIKSDDWMIQIAKLVDPKPFGIKRFAPQFKTVQTKNPPDDETYVLPDAGGIVKPIKTPPAEPARKSRGQVKKYKGGRNTIRRHRAV